MRRYLRFAVFVAALVALAALAAGCGSKKNSNGSTTTTSSSQGGGASTPSKSYDNGSPAKGGTYTVGWEQSFGFTDNFDPTGEYLGNAWGIYVNLLTRSLIGYKHQPGAAGNELIGDLATDVPQPTDGGLTYTYKLRSGIKFGPPVNRVITSKDVAYALDRLADANDGGEYGFYYTVIKGWDAASKAKSFTPVSGISTPDNNTLVIHLTKPTGDFNLRMSMPATAPIPPEVGKCFEGKPGDYGRDLISSGPYTMVGSVGTTFSSCSALKPFSGYAGADGNHISLVRNPNYDQSTDPYRKNYPDKFNFVINSNADDIFNKVTAGQYDDEQSSPSPKTLRQYATTANLKARLLPNVGDRTWYITMNLTQAPFDDIHVRKAMNYIMDKNALRLAWGGPIEGQVATHIVPPVLYGGGLSEYDPYASPNESGDLAKAMAEMKQSKYDPGKTGKCTASACKGVLMIGDTRAVDNRMIPVIQADAKKIGITFTVRQINGAYTTIQTPSKNVPISERPGWGKDYADPYTFFGELFDGRAIIKSGNTNYSLVGLDAATAKSIGVKGNLTNLPTVNPDIDSCQTKLNQARVTCWENLDKKLMTQVVPWIPYLWSNNVFIVGPKVTHWNYDQFSDGPAYSQVSVKQ
ncbi:MAG TPA: ABC transporter substrate-binding protein [Gaiellaceae bacterium]|nr:ABC transporter substrate-binding protein [Gaiellaceae bacterium]